MIIAIDGPAGSGKSTVAKIIAQRLGFLYLDTGAIYRAVGYLALKKGIDLEDEKALVNLIRQMELTITPEKGHQKIAVNGEDITEKIRTEEIGMAASTVSKHPEVRKALLELQRDFGRRCNLVTEGRDTTTVVFPNAEVKIFLTASPEVRAERRLKELKEKGIEKSYEEVLNAIIKRDRQDTERAVAPLKPAEDAVIIDTSGMSIEEVVEEILKIVEKAE
ncbi:MAG: (d)CMP kinase [Deferribacteres bacterium]|nr:(d)CMP kinase [Deferribacteres bacterium]